MVPLTIDLREGFKDDTVVIQLNGQEVYRRENISTRLQTGFSDRLEVEVEEGAIEISVALPLKKTSVTQIVQLSERTFIGIELTMEGSLSIQVQSHEFMYA